MEIKKTQPRGLIARVRAAVRHRDRDRCTKCGATNDAHITKSGRSLDVHRITPGSKYSLEGCVLLCRQCHGREPKRHPGEPDLAKAAYFTVRIPGNYRALFQSLHDKHRRSITTELQIALEKHAEEQGFALS